MFRNDDNRSPLPLARSKPKKRRAFFISGTQSVSAWVIGIGVILGHALWENEWSRIRGGALAYAVYSAMQIIALFRFPDQIIFGASFWVYIVILVSGVGLGWYGWITAQKIHRAGK